MRRSERGGLIALLVLFFVPTLAHTQTKITLQGISESQCYGLGGQVTEVTMKETTCPANQFTYGNVIGMMCPCICCGPISLEAAKGADIREALAAIPDANLAATKRVRRAKTWRNPRLVVRPLGIDINGTAVRVQPADLASALSRIPPKKWPYGRAIALQYVGTLESNEAVSKHRDAIVAILKELKVEVVTGLIDENPGIR